MGGRVIQGFFIGGAMRPQPASRAAAGEPQPGRPTGAPLQARMAPGRPPLAHQSAGSVAQPHGGNGSVEIDPGQLGLVRGGGTPLPRTVLAKMEAAFGEDFSAVRVHVGPQAARIGAIAFTTGNDLYFAPGQFQPESIKGQQLIGHELAHVIQQRQGRVRSPGTGVAIVQDRTLEAEADRLGMRAAAHRGPVAQPRMADVRAPISHARAPLYGPVLRRVAPPDRHVPGSRRMLQAMFSIGTGGGTGGTGGGSAMPTVSTAPTLSSRLMLWRARLQGDASMSTGTFTVDEFCTFVGGYGSIGSRSGQLGLLRELRDAGVVFPTVTEPVRQGLILSLDATLAQQAPTVTAPTITNRVAFNMVNPPHDHPNMIPFWAAHAHTPPPSGRDPLTHYMSPTRNFRIGDNDGNPVLDSSGAQVLEQGHSNLVMGHNPSASTYINATGHQHSPGTNRQHNFSASAYGQVENARSSAQSGSREPRYRSPSPTRGSWPGYYQSTHPRFRPQYRDRWPTHIRTQCGACGNEADRESATHCSVCGAAY
jgi:hypothetical protein